MKYLITERQLKLIKEDNIRKIDFDIFNNDWALLQKFLERRGNPPYIITGDLNLYGLKIESLGNLQSVGGYLYLTGSNIESLGNLQSVGGYLYLTGSNIESLGNLQSVGGNLDLNSTKIESLGNLQSVGGNLYLNRTPLSKITTEKEIRNQVEVGGGIYL
jgi:hypothetical protein